MIQKKHTGYFMKFSSVQQILMFSFISFSFYILGTEIQDSGEKPSPYHQFTHIPTSSLSIISKYLPENPVIVEAGAFDGKESVILATFFKNCHVHSFEPINRLYKKVQSATKKFSNISTYNLALGEAVGERIMYISKDLSDPNSVSMSSSIYEPKEHLIYSPDVFFDEKEIIQITTLDAWADHYGIPKVDMLWLDLQGAELATLKASPKTFSNVSVILTELEFIEAYINQPLYKEVRAWLEEQGFVLIGGNFSFPKDPRQWFGDGLFIRKDLLLK